MPEHRLPPDPRGSGSKTTRRRRRGRSPRDASAPSSGSCRRIRSAARSGARATCPGSDHATGTPRDKRGTASEPRLSPAHPRRSQKAEGTRLWPKRRKRSDIMTKSAIGFIGLGLMGSAMVQRLLDLGYPMTIMANRARPNVDAAVARGAREVGTARDVAAASDIVMLCMDTSASVEARMRGPDGVIAGLKSGTVVIDFGTSLPASTRALGDEVAAIGSIYMDAPLGRTPSHGREGKLNIMCSGDKMAYDRIKPILDDLGENIFHLGTLGSGHTIKLINNFFAMTTASAMAEAFAMADVAKIGRRALYDVMSAGPLHSNMMDFITSYAVDGDPKRLAFTIKNAAKDVGYYERMIQETGLDPIVSKGTLAALAEARDGGFAEHLVPQMVDFFAARKDA
ncbi:MAG: NAD(P)-dependent oxidoreductase [Pseudomonadota bacterium]